ncbi:restriction endonuclease subunit S [Octadecabacter sp.]|nr:restriction endonuclease subunit S [Octadecabacter sp.]
MVPDGWADKPLGQQVRITSGGTPKRNQPEFWGGTIPWITTAEVNYSTIDSSVEQITEDGLAGSSAKLFPKGTLLVAMYGQGKTRGQVGILGIEAATNQACAALLDTGEANLNFLYHRLSDDYEVLRNLANDGAQKNLSGGLLKSYSFPTPPIPEQRKIADILSTWDQAIEKTEALLSNARTQKRALMQSLLTGTHRFPEFDGRTTHSEKTQNDWKICRLGEICQVKGGKRLPKGRTLSEVPTPHPYIRVSDMRDGYIDTSKILYVPEDIAHSIKRYRISKDDLFISVAGTLGLVGKVPHELDDANLTENADKLTDITVDRDFLLFVLQSPWVQKPIQNEKTTNAQPKLALERIRGFRVPVPSLKEQQMIAAVLNDCVQEITSLINDANHLRTEKKALMQQLLTGKRRVVV